MFQGRQLIDISPVISSRIAVYPGDTPFREEFALHMSRGDNLTLSSITTSVHVGAHTDAPNHYSPHGASIESRSLDFYLGPAQVIEVPNVPNARIAVQDIENVKIEAPRVLFKTNSFPDPDKWNHDFMSLSSDLVRYLAAKKVRLVGIDTPSIDLADDKILESHNAILENDMAILEGIVLTTVAPGLYDLIALPLKIEGADATPVRAILLK